MNGNSGRLGRAIGQRVAILVVLSATACGFGTSAGRITLADPAPTSAPVPASDSMPAAAPTTPAPTTASAAPTTTPAAGGCPSEPGYTGCRVDTVTYVVDGDTIQLGGGAQIRFLGMDTPERGRCGYDEATTRVRELVDDQTVTVVHSDGNTTDKYGRELGYIEIGGTDVGRLLIAEGYAHARYDGLDGYPTHPRQADYRALDAATTNRCDTAPTDPDSINPFAALPATPAPPQPPTTAAATPPPPGAGAGACNPSYDPCLPIVSDLNCPQIGHRVRVLDPASDPYNLDADSDGMGCESFPNPPGW